MKNKDWMKLRKAIFFTTTEKGWEENWDILTENGKMVTNISNAKEFVRETMNDQNVGLATFKQMKFNNAQWDNL